MVSLSVGAIALALSACSSAPPTAEMAVSTAAVNHAAAAGGPELAPVAMLAAREKLALANTALTEKHYHRARELAAEAQVDAQLAESQAGAMRARTAADAVGAGQRALKDELDRNAR